MPEPISRSEFDDLLRDSMDVPEPAPEFMGSLRAQFLSGRINVSNTPRPNVADQLSQRKSLMQTLRARPVLVVLIALLALALLSGAAYAIGRSLGYIPGLGIINQSAPIRVLAAPVSQTRDGITIAVKDAVITSDQVAIVFTVENIPVDKLSPPHDMQCLQWAELRLPGGTLLQVSPGASGGSQDGRKTLNGRVTYAPVPANVSDVTLLIPCVQGAAPGVLPEKWELPLHFVPAPPDMTVMPVIEVSAAPAPVSGFATAVPSPLSITKVIDTSDRYILIGVFNPPAPSQAGVDWSSTGSIKLSDANGQEIVYDLPQDIQLPPSESPKADVWSIEFSKGFAPPLRITYSNLYTLHAPSQATVEFEFDAGPDPHEGQIWQLNKEIQLAGHTFTLVSISVSPGDFYRFDFTSSDNKISSVGIQIPGYTPNGGGQDTCGCIQPPPASWGESLGYAELPKGKLNVVLSGLDIYGESKDWTLEWQP